MRILVVAEHDGTRVRLGSRSAVSMARDLAAHIGGETELLLLGHGLERVTADAVRLGNVLVADHPDLSHPTADRYAAVISDVATAHSAGFVVGAATTFGKDILPRVTALLRGAMAGDVTGWGVAGGELCFKRPVYAGAALASVVLAGAPQVISLRTSAFPPAAPLAASGESRPWEFNAAALPAGIEFVGLESRSTSRPELTEARVVVSGGRPFRNEADFEQHVGRLADALQGAAGCTRALVDAGITPNEWQVGQTGKVVAPDLYIALGISGSIQHLAGMKNSRVVVAVNQDPDAPIFSVANYGLVGDVRQVVPELIRELGR